MKPTNKILLGAFMAAVIGGCSVFGKKKPVAVDKTTTPAAYDLRNNMRKLWDDNNVWTHNVLVGQSTNTPGTEEAKSRLFKNQDDITSAMVIYYTDASPKLSDLMKDHIELTAELVKASKGKKKKGGSTADIEKKYDENADAIADYFAKTNPAIKGDNIKSMMQAYLKLTKEQADARVKRDYKADIEAYDKADDASVAMADSISMGIIRQFPDKF